MTQSGELDQIVDTRNHRLILSFVVRGRSHEGHFSLFTYRKDGERFIQTFWDYGPVVSSYAEPWIWIDWPLAFKSLPVLIQAPFRYITRRFSRSSPRRAA